MSDNTVEIVITAKNLAAKTLKKTASMVTKTVGGAVKKLARSLTSLKTLAVTAFAGWGLKKLGGSFIKTAASTERYKTILETVLKSAERAKEYFAWITDFAATTPFEIPGLVEAATRLEAYQLNAKKYLRVLGDTAGAMGKPIMAAVEMIADASQGEFERLKEFGFRATDVAKRAGFASVQIMNSTRENLAKGTEALMAMLKERYAGGMEKLSGTLEGMWSNLKDYWFKIKMLVMDAGVFDSVKNFISSIAREIEALSKSGKLKVWAEAAGKALDDAFSRAEIMFWHMVERVKELHASGKLKEWADIAKKSFELVWTVIKKVTQAVVWLGKQIGIAAAKMVDFYEKFKRNQFAWDDEKNTVRVKFEGEGSTVKPLSEKIAEMQNKVAAFSDYVANAGANYTVNATGATSALATAMESVNANYESKLQNMISYVAARQNELSDVSRGHKPYMFGTYRNILKGQIETGTAQMENLIRTWQAEQKLTAKYYGGNATTNLGGITINASGGVLDWRNLVRTQIIPELRAAGVV